MVLRSFVPEMSSFPKAARSTLNASSPNIGHCAFTRSIIDSQTSKIRPQQNKVEANRHVI